MSYAMGVGLAEQVSLRSLESAKRSWGSKCLLSCLMQQKGGQNTRDTKGAMKRANGLRTTSMYTPTQGSTHTYDSSHIYIHAYTCNMDHFFLGRRQNTQKNTTHKRNLFRPKNNQTHTHETHSACQKNKRTHTPTHSTHQQTQRYSRVAKKQKTAIISDECG